MKEYGADVTITVDMLKERLGKLEGVNVVINPLGSTVWEHAVEALDVAGRLVTFGVLTGEEGRINIGKLYRREMEIIGSTGGNRTEFMHVMKLAENGKLTTKVWKTFGLEEASEAVKALRSDDRDGRLLIKP